MRTEFAAELEQFEEFLSKRVFAGAISAYRLEFFPSLRDLRSSWGRSDLEHVSRTHKEIREDEILGIEVIKSPGVFVGIDLETAGSLGRPVLSRPAFLARRFKLNPDIAPADILLEWVRREACFKALYPKNVGLLLSDFSNQHIGPTDSLLLAPTGQSLSVSTVGQKLILGFARVI